MRRWQLSDAAWHIGVKSRVLGIPGWASWSLAWRTSGVLRLPVAVQRSEQRPAGCKQRLCVMRWGVPPIWP